MEHEMFWKEVVVLTLVAIFSFGFYSGIDKPGLYIGFTLISLAFYIVSLLEEKNPDKKIHDYFKHTSSYFAAATVAFIGSYLLLLAEHGLVLLTLALAIILFSVGFMHLLFARVK